MKKSQLITLSLALLFVCAGFFNASQAGVCAKSIGTDCPFGKK